MQVISTLARLAGTLGLDRRVLYAEPLIDHLSDCLANHIRIATLGQCHVNGAADIIVRHRPDMKVVKACNPIDLSYRRPDVC